MEETNQAPYVKVRADEACRAYSYNRKYYMDTVTFEVEGELFKIPKVYLTGQSDVFKGMFTFPLGDGAAEEGLSDENPISLPIPSKLEFERFLDVVMQRQNPALELSLEHWLAALRLGSMWEFTSVRAEAIRELSAYDLPIMEQLHLGRTFGVREWIVEAYECLVARDEYITEAEVGVLGLGLALKLGKLREVHRENKLSGGRRVVNIRSLRDQVEELVGDKQSRTKIPEPELSSDSSGSGPRGSAVRSRVMVITNRVVL